MDGYEVDAGLVGGGVNLLICSGGDVDVDSLEFAAALSGEIFFYLCLSAGRKMGQFDAGFPLSSASALQLLRLFSLLLITTSFIRLKMNHRSTFQGAFWRIVDIFAANVSMVGKCGLLLFLVD